MRPAVTRKETIFQILTAASVKIATSQKGGIFN
jgi:hypothetical protein